LPWWSRICVRGTAARVSQSASDLKAITHELREIADKMKGDNDQGSGKPG